MKKDIVAMLLAGGVGTRLGILARKRAKPAIPFGGIYRIIDFTMSNVANSGIDVIGILTQYKPLSLMEHIDNGRPWDLFGRSRLVEILPPKTGEEISDWYKGTSDAVYQNMAFIEDFSPDLILIVSGDHIYHMDYNELRSFHEAKKAEATICLIRVPMEQAGQFGTAVVDKNHRITNWKEKPARPKSNLVSMGIYIFNKRVLEGALNASAKKGGTDFAKHIIPVLLRKYKVFGFEFNGYWRDVGSIDAYWNSNLDILRPESDLDLNNWGIKTNLWVKGEIGDRSSAYFGRHARVQNSLVARGCVIEGILRNSILSPGVIVHKNAVVEDSILFHDTVIGAGAVIQNSIIDKNVLVGEAVFIGKGPLITNKRHPDQMSAGITVVGKGVEIAPGISIGRSCIINPDRKLTKGGLKNIDSGITI